MNIQEFKLKNQIYKITNLVNNSVLIYESKKECIKNFKMTVDKLNSNIKNKKIHDNTYLFEKND